MKKPIYLDVMLHGKSICQLPFFMLRPILTDSGVIPAVDNEEVTKFVIEKRPSLKGLPFNVIITNNKVL